MDLIVAMAANRCIGLNNDLPWHLPDDLRRFRALTLGRTCIMGRLTFESIVRRINRPLPGRRSLVLSRGAYRYDHPDVVVVPSLAGIDTRAMILCGGASLYAEFLPRVQRMHLTLLDRAVAGDAFFPPWDPADWQIVTQENVQGPEPFRFLTLMRNE